MQRAASALGPIGEFRSSNGRKAARTRAANGAEEDGELVEPATPPATTAPPEAEEEDTDA